VLKPILSDDMIVSLSPTEYNIVRLALQYLGAGAIDPEAFGAPTKEDMALASGLNHYLGEEKEASYTVTEVHPLVGEPQEGDDEAQAHLDAWITNKEKE